jgi:uncharacterized protein (DUF169 family)
MDIKFYRQSANDMASILGLGRSPVGIRFLITKDSIPEEAMRLERHRYCQALMLAGRGEPVILDEAGIACPAAAAAFGFRALPVGLESGKGLVGFGIIADPEVGKRMFADMPRLAAGRLAALHLFPLEKTVFPPDIIAVEDEVERLMWIALAALHADGGRRLRASTAVLQATCVDSAVIPFLENRLNFCYGCYGCRDATDIKGGEAVLGFPAGMLTAIVEHLAFLQQKAIPASRAKKALADLKRRRSTE